MLQPNQPQLMNPYFVSNTISNPLTVNGNQPDMMSILVSLQQTVNQQSMILQLLLKQQTMQQSTLQNESSSHLMNAPERVDFPQSILAANPMKFTEGYNIKEESFRELNDMIKREDINFIVKQEPSMDTASSFEELLCPPENNMNMDLSQVTQEPDTLLENSTKKKYFKIIRKSNFVKPRKSNKLTTPKCPPSDAKHLWINYGRKIIDFALEHTKGDVNERVKLLVGKINSRKDFENVFKVLSGDTLSERAFKAIFGRMALYFMYFKADTAFEDAKYKTKMILQKSNVLTLITKVMNQSFPQNNLNSGNVSV